MNRRQAAIAFLALGAGPFVDAGAQPAPRKLGILSMDPVGGPIPADQSVLLSKLHQLGWIEGRNLTVVRRFADAQVDQLARFSDELVNDRVDAIFALGSDSAIAAARATSAVPIVFVGVPNPVEMGLIESFAKPGRNVTGVSTATGSEFSTKRLQFLKEIAPAARRLSWITTPHLSATVKGAVFDDKPFLEAEAGKLGYEVRWHKVEKTEDLDAAFSEILAWRAEALAVPATVVTFVARHRIAGFALANRLPTASVFYEFAEAGGLLTYAAGDLATLIEITAAYVDKVLRGARPHDLPVDRPTRYELVLNLRTAKALGMTVPQSLLVRADRLIE